MKIRAPKLFGNFAYLIGQLVFKSMRVQHIYHPSLDTQEQCIYGFWHAKQVLPVMIMRELGSKKHAALVSTSKDGEIIAIWLSKLGYKVIRGSSSKKAISGMVQLLNSTKQGYSIGIAADGPRGPRLEVKSGTAFLAYKTGLSIVPLGIAYSKSFIFKKAWDQFQFPKPFSKAVIYFGAPIGVSGKEDIGPGSERFAHALREAEDIAYQILRGKKVDSQAEVKTSS